MQENNKHESDTIRQQRKAREEFLELKRMQSGETTPPPPSANSVLPTTVKEKAANYWFYNKWLVLGTVFLIIFMLICIKQCASRLDYDLAVVVYTSTPIGDKSTDKMAEYFENICDDVNGDGEVHVQIYNCSYAGDGNSQALNAKNTKLQAIIASEYKAMLFITDDNTLEYFNSVESFKNLFVNSLELSAEFHNFCDVDNLYLLPSNLRLLRRGISETAMNKNTTALACYNAAGRIINRINGAK